MTLYKHVLDYVHGSYVCHRKKCTHKNVLCTCMFCITIVQVYLQKCTIKVEEYLIRRKRYYVHACSV